MRTSADAVSAVNTGSVDSVRRRASLTAISLMPPLKFIYLLIVTRNVFYVPINLLHNVHMNIWYIARIFARSTGITVGDGAHSESHEK